ncbi:MAG TPA: hypothetical protein PKH80_01950 [Methanofastidiosum sp.]|nr:hypothetical protein [Methanofastidiosum sp.]HNU62328.1 hypothetical protein [Methanofastidiosum sp.]
MTTETITIDRKVVEELISDIESKLEELEAVLNIELSERISDIELGKVEGLSEKELYELLE